LDLLRCCLTTSHLFSLHLDRHGKLVRRNNMSRHPHTFEEFRLLLQVLLLLLLLLLLL
jgi:hypothetical protein